MDGLLGKENCNFNSLGMEMFENIAPVLPEKTLSAIERAASGDGGAKFTSRLAPHYYAFVRLLWHLAYQPELFDRSVMLICCYALSEQSQERHNSIRNILKSLFQVYFSGTNASIDARAKIIQGLVDSAREDEKELGLFLLDAALEAVHFSSVHDFDFGARPRDYGYYPKSQKEIVDWYNTFISICTQLAFSDEPISNQARDILANNLQSLCVYRGMFEYIENPVKQIHAKKVWNEGWLAVRGVIRFVGKRFDEDILTRLKKLEKILKPNDLLDRVRAFAFSPYHKVYNLNDNLDNNDGASKQVEEATRQIGIELAQDVYTLNTILPELFTSQHHPRLDYLGGGLADGCDNKQELLNRLYSQFAKTHIDERKRIDVLLGFFSSCYKSDPEFYNQALDNLVNDELLGSWAPLLQTTGGVDQLGLKRLYKVLDVGNAEIYAFKHIAYGRSHESIDDNDLADLLKKIISKDGGVNVSIEILCMRLSNVNKTPYSCSKNLMIVMRDTLSKHSFSNEKSQHIGLDIDFSLGRVATVCLRGDEGKNAAIDLASHFVEAQINKRISALKYPALLNTLADVQPIIFLDYLLENEAIEKYKRQIFFTDKNPLNQISEEILIAWCDAVPETRYSLILSEMDVFSESDDGSELLWKPIVYTIFKKAPHLSAILDCLMHAIYDTSGSGTHVGNLLRRLALLKIFFNHENTEISEWARKLYSSIQGQIDKEREWENPKSEQYVTFE
jgi:hypothetical protein